MTINLTPPPPPVRTAPLYEHGEQVTVRIEGVDRPAVVRGRCHPVGKGDYYDVMLEDRTIHCDVRADQINPPPMMVEHADAPVLRLGRAAR